MIGMKKMIEIKFKCDTCGCEKGIVKCFMDNPIPYVQCSNCFDGECIPINKYVDGHEEYDA